LHLIRYGISGFDYYLVVLGMDNSGIKSVNFSEIWIRAGLKPSASFCLDGKTE
jgi:hypothetical protein